MTPQRRELLLRLMDGYIDPKLPVYLFHLNHFLRCEDICRYLIRHGITGRLLLQYIEIDSQGSVFAMAKEVLRRLRNEKEMPKIIYGRDYTDNVL